MQVNILSTNRLADGTLRVAGSVTTSDRRYGFEYILGQGLTLRHDNGRRVPTDHLAAIRAEVTMTVDSYVGQDPSLFIGAPASANHVNLAAAFSDSLSEPVAAPVELSEPVAAPVELSEPVAAPVEPATIAAAWSEKRTTVGTANPFRRLVLNYRYFRTVFNHAAPVALARARQELGRGKDHYLPSRGINAQDSDGCRWVADPDRHGLRLVETSKTRYAADRHGDSFVQGLVFQLPARNGKPLFVAGHVDPHNDGPARIDFTDLYSGEHEQSLCKHSADSLAQRYAEKSFAHDVAFAAGSAYANLKSENADARVDLVAYRLIRRNAALWQAEPVAALGLPLGPVAAPVKAKIDRKAIHWIVEFKRNTYDSRDLRQVSFRAGNLVDKQIAEIRRNRATMESLRAGESMSDYVWDSRDSDQRATFLDAAQG